jgi:hypothetical protein
MADARINGTSDNVPTSGNYESSARIVPSKLNLPKVCSILAFLSVESPIPTKSRVVGFKDKFAPSVINLYVVFFDIS